MFFSTQCLTFRTIASFGRFKIHPPLPLTPRESTQLLKLLTTLFRDQLDHEHGVIASGDNVKGKPIATFPPKLGPGKYRRQLQPKSDNRSPTDRHLNSVLTNPLFKNVEKDLPSSSHEPRDPMDIFDEACAKGFMKLEYATACLKAKKRDIVKSSVFSVRDAMKLSHAGSKTLKWMFSSGIANNSSFLEDEIFSEILVEFLVAEELQSVIWTWLETLFSQISSTDLKSCATSLVKDAARLLYHLVRAEAAGSVNLDAAIRSLGRAENMMPRSRRELRPILNRAGAYIYWETVHHHASRPTPSPEMFDVYLSVMPRSSVRNKIAFSNLLLYHPTKPDATSALKCLEMANKIATTAPDPETRCNVLRDKHYDDERTIYLGLNTARFLLEREQHGKAHWVMNFVQETYGTQLGLSQHNLLSQIEQARAEVSSVELLSSLNLT